MIEDYKLTRNGLIVMSALRYALGRKTYMPGVVMEFIEDNLEEFDDKFLFNVNKELYGFLEYETVDFNDVNIIGWVRLKSIVKEEIKHRVNKSNILLEGE